jgi:hypothetical protein
MSVPIACPECGVDHLHAAVYVEAEAGDRFQVVADGQDGDTVLVRYNPGGRVKPPREVHLECCACDWTTDRFTRWVGEAPT